MRIASQLYGIIGAPLGHSLSPLLHNWAMEQANWPGAYLAWPVEPDQIADFMIATRTLPVAGVSVTIPHKQAVMEHCDVLSEAARTVGAVNTLYWREGELIGDNTDLAGFLAPLQGKRLASALVLGAGGAARAVLAGLASLQVKDVYVTNRTADRCAALAAEFGAIIVDWKERGAVDPDLLVNATPLGMRGERVAETPWPAKRFRAGQIAYDLVYNPLETRFLREASRAGCVTIDGLTMFLGQAAAQFAHWTGKTFDGKAARALLLEALAG